MLPGFASKKASERAYRFYRDRTRARDPLRCLETLAGDGPISAHCRLPFAHGLGSFRPTLSQHTRAVLGETILSLLLLWLAASSPLTASAQPLDVQSDVVTVHVTPKPANTFVAARALGAGVDGLNEGRVAKTYTPDNIAAMKSAGLGALTYRLRTELGVEAWHWNPAGRWSEGAKAQGYWTSDARAGAPIAQCYGYKLPRRGSTIDQANNDGYSRLDDGDAGTFWKSNPYLDERFTGENNARHPQWALIDLGRARPVDAILIAWAAPYATRYQVQYWDGDNAGEDTRSIDDTFGDGAWRAFPQGTQTQGRGGIVRLRLAAAPRPARFVRVWMTESGGAMPGAGDVRDGLGYAVREIGLGTLDGRGAFHDLMLHTPDGRRQTPIYVSSTDPWHQSGGRDPNVEQPGFDRVFRSGLASGLPVLMPAGVLYDTPENAAAELRFLRARGYPVTRMELGEEPDGQYASPEDYGALYLQWADALHRVDPALQLGGPSFQTAVEGWVAWPDARGDRSWLRRFLGYLKRRGRTSDFNFFSFEWYPFDDVGAPPAPKLLSAPGLLENALARLQREGLPRSVPWLITEYGYSAFAGEAEMTWPGALLNAETAAQFLTLGGSESYLYGYEPNIPIREAESGQSWGNLALLLSDAHAPPKPLAAYHAARLLTRQWAQPDTGEPQAVYRATSATRGRQGLSPVTAYAVRRPDGRWAVLLLNKDPKRVHSVAVRFARAEGHSPVVPFSGPADLYQYSAAQYVWHSDGARGRPALDLPPVHGTYTGGPVLLPPFSLSVLRGSVVGPP